MGALWERGTIFGGPWKSHWHHTWMIVNTYIYIYMTQKKQQNMIHCTELEIQIDSGYVKTWRCHKCWKHLWKKPAESHCRSRDIISEMMGLGNYKGHWITIPNNALLRGDLSILPYICSCFHPPKIGNLMGPELGKSFRNFPTLWTIEPSGWSLATW